jgi:hypothetical protein
MWWVRHNQLAIGEIKLGSTTVGVIRKLSRIPNNIKNIYDLYRAKNIQNSLTTKSAFKEKMVQTIFGRRWQA